MKSATNFTWDVCIFCHFLKSASFAFILTCHKKQLPLFSKNEIMPRQTLEAVRHWLGTQVDGKPFTILLQ